MWAALDGRKSHNSIMRLLEPLPGLLQTFLCILNFLVFTGKRVKNGMGAKMSVNYYTGHMRVLNNNVTCLGKALNKLLSLFNNNNSMMGMFSGLV